MSFNIYRSDANQAATDFDLGDLEFVFDDHIVSSRGNSRLLNMIYISIADLIYGLFRLKNGAKSYVFVGTDSSFSLKFETNKKGVFVRHGKDFYGPIVLNELFGAIDSGIDLFLLDPSNRPSGEGGAFDDFNRSRCLLKQTILKQ